MGVIGALGKKRDRLGSLECPSSFLASSWIDFLYISVEFIGHATRPGGMFDPTDP